MMYKGIRFDIHHHIRAVAGNVNMHHVAPRVRDWHCTARNEVKSFSQQTLRGALHTLGVERLVKMRHS